MHQAQPPTSLRLSSTEATICRAEMERKQIDLYHFFWSWHTKHLSCKFLEENNDIKVDSSVQKNCIFRNELPKVVEKLFAAFQGPPPSSFSA